MEVIEFTTELNALPSLPIPGEAAIRLPKSGKARVIVIPESDTDDAAWRADAYAQFLRDDDLQDEIYEQLR